MKARRQRQDLRVFTNGRDNDNDHLLHLNGEIPTPTAGMSTPRRIVKSLKTPPACVTQLVQLDNSQPHQPMRRFSSIAMSLPSDCSVSEVRSELCSCAVDEGGDISMSSLFDRKRLERGRKGSMQRADTGKLRGAGVGAGAVGGGGASGRNRSRHQLRRRNSGAAKGAAASRAAGGAEGRCSREAEESILSYTDSGSFYSCESLENSSISRSVHSNSSDSCCSVSYTAISESVPSCSLTIMGDQVTRVPVAPGWGGRGRRNPPAARKHSESFGSIFGGGIDPYDGTSISSNPMHGNSHAASSTTPSSSAGVSGASVFHMGDRRSGNGNHSKGPLGHSLTDAVAAAKETENSLPDLGSTVLTLHDNGGTETIRHSPRRSSLTSSPEDLNVTQRHRATSPSERQSNAKADTQRDSVTSQLQLQGKRKVVTIAGVSPKKEKRSSLFDDVAAPDGTTAAATATAVAASGQGSSRGQPDGTEPGSPAGGSSGREVDENGNPVWRVTRAQREERIGRGSYGDVYRGTDLDTGRTIAIKEILVPKDFTKDLEKQLQALEREIRVMRKLHHPNTINYLGAVRDDNSLNIYMEFVSGGTVGELLRGEGPLTEEHTRGYTEQLLCGLEYLHDRQIVHRDLKGDNLFISEGDVLKVGDFGTSKELVTTLVTDSVAGTPNFMAPEVIACSGHSYAADIWSVGCCVLEMITGMPPFAKLDNHMAVMFAVMKGKLEEQVPQHISSGAKDFISMCTRHDPKERWNVSQLRQHPWLLDSAATALSAPSAINTTTTTTTATTTAAAAPPSPTTEVANNGGVPAAVTAAARAEAVLPHEERRRPAGAAGARSPRAANKAKGSPPTTTASRKRVAAAADGSAATLMPPIPSPSTGRKPKSATPLEPAALARAGGSAAKNLLPAAVKSPLPARSEDGEAGGTTSSDPSSNGNSPSSRPNNGKGKRASVKTGGTPVLAHGRGGGEATALDAAVAVTVTDVAPPTRLTSSAARGGSGRASGRKKGSGGQSRSPSTASSPTARAKGPVTLAPLQPHKPPSRTASARERTGTPTGRRRPSKDTGTNVNTDASSPAVASPPNGSPTGNPRRGNVPAGTGTNPSGGSNLLVAPTPSPPKDKRKKSKLSV